ENATQGFWNGGVPPIGYKVVEIKNGEGKKKVLEIDEESENAVKEIYELFLKGYGLKKISGMLNEEEFKTNRGNSFSPSTVRGILKNEAYAGTLIWNKYDKKTKGKKYKDKKDWVKIDGRIPKIIDKKDFDTVQKMFEERKKVSPKSLGRTHVLSGLIKCGLCGSNYIYARRSKVRGTHKYETSYYVCGNKDKLSGKACSNIALKSPQIEDYIVNLLNSKLLSPDNVKKIIYDMHKDYSDIREEVKNKGKSIKESIKRIDTKIANIYKAVESGFNQKLLEERLEELKAKKDDFLNELESLRSEKAKPYSEKDVVEFTNSIREKMKSLGDEELNHYLKFFISSIKVTPEEMFVHFTFSLPEPTLSSFLMVPRGGIEPSTRGFSVH
ncbi:MAG: recombinase family protein, partial [Caldisericaceae bacterium]